VIRAVAVALAVVASAAACKQKREEPREVLVAMQAFTNQMCSCKIGDKACADKVQEGMQRWGTEMARRADQRERMDEELLKQLTEVTQKYTECTTKVTAGESPPVEPQPSGDHLPPPPPAGKPVAIDAQLRVVRDYAARLHPGGVLSRLAIRYARADGTLDPTYGKLELYYNRPPAEPADDPKRPIGAPVPAPPVDPATLECPLWTLEKSGWVRSMMPCMGGMRLAFPRCSVAQVWARAIADQAPKAALATLVLVEGAAGAQKWQFAISDPPRKIDFQRTYPDDCEPVLEQPLK
jgi:hypothetical protein